MGSGGGGRGRELTRGSGVHCGSPGERLCGSCSLCCVFSLSVSLLFLFPLFAVLLNCTYPDPPGSACFFPFSSAPWRGEERPRGAFVASHSQTITELFYSEGGHTQEEAAKRLWILQVGRQSKPDRTLSWVTCCNLWQHATSHGSQKARKASKSKQKQQHFIG